MGDTAEQSVGPPPIGAFDDLGNSQTMADFIGNIWAETDYSSVISYFKLGTHAGDPVFLPGQRLAYRIDVPKGVSPYDFLEIMYWYDQGTSALAWNNAQWNIGSNQIDGSVWSQIQNRIVLEYMYVITPNGVTFGGSGANLAAVPPGWPTTRPDLPLISPQCQTCLNGLTWFASNIARGNAFLTLAGVGAGVAACWVVCKTT